MYHFILVQLVNFLISYFGKETWYFLSSLQFTEAFRGVSRKSQNYIENELMCSLLIYCIFFVAYSSPLSVIIIPL